MTVNVTGAVIVKILNVNKAVDRSGACAALCAVITEYFGHTFAGKDVSTAYRAGRLSHPTGDYGHIVSAPAGSFVFCKQKPGHTIMGYTPPDPGHVFFKPTAKDDLYCITDRDFGVLVPGFEYLRHGTLEQYLAVNDDVEFWMWTPDYAGAYLNAPAAAKPPVAPPVTVPPTIPPAAPVDVTPGTAPVVVATPVPVAPPVVVPPVTAPIVVKPADPPSTAPAEPDPVVPTKPATASKPWIAALIAGLAILGGILYGILH